MTSGSGSLRSLGKGRRLPNGGSAIDRTRQISFRFDREEMSGFAGDTIASALIANGVDVVCSSPILGRPRGVMSAGVEEPCAFVAVDEPYIEVISAATAVGLTDGLQVHGVPGVGRLPYPAGSDRRSLRRRNAHVETLVIGAGAAGLAAARAAGATGRTLLIDEHLSIPDLHLPVNSDPGGPLSFGGDGIAVLLGTTALGVYDDGYAVLNERDQRVWHVRAGRVILATGAHERPVAFAGNDRPGVMLASAVVTYLERYGVMPGNRAVLFTTNDSGTTAAESFRAAGGEVAAVADARRGEAVVSTEGSPRVSSVRIRTGDARESVVEADLLLVAGGWNPVLGLWRSIGGGLRFDQEKACFVPDGGAPDWLSVTGAAAGDVPASAPIYRVERSDPALSFVDFQRDQTVADVIEAVEEGLRSVEHVKRATYIGTAIDQGRTSGVLTAALVNAALGAEPGAQGPTSSRPPSSPVSFGALAGELRRDLLDPIRRTSIHGWHEERGAPMEAVGQWKRPWYFPQGDEDIEAAVLRECRTARTAVGVMDASTLGKIEIVGPDSGEFLDLMYTNRMSDLRAGSIRYGIMLGVDGMVADDGVCMRLDEDRFMVVTTTGGAAYVMDRFDEWLQTELPRMRVWCTSVTEQWAVISVVGPRARDVVAAAGSDIDVSRDAFPHMTFREGDVAGIASRVARVSFSGEPTFEINVPWSCGRDVWEAVIGAGEPFGIQPYGTQTMHVLRAEKGYPIVGQETDGSMTADDLGLGWLLKREGNFVGKRALQRADLVRPGRRQLVGLLPEDPQALVPEGAQLAWDDDGTRPLPMAGFVTSSYRSAALERTFALAMVSDGRAMHGRRIIAPLHGIWSEVVDPVFYDGDGERLRA